MRGLGVKNEKTISEQTDKVKEQEIGKISESQPVVQSQKTEIKDVSEKGMAVVGYTMHIKEKLKEA